jgi:predicted DNA-binding transcriptional regulator AlpA
MKISIDDEEVMNIHEVMKILEIKEYDVYKKIEKGELPPPIKPEHRAFWKKSDIESYLELRRDGTGE